MGIFEYRDAKGRVLDEISAKGNMHIIGPRLGGRKPHAQDLCVHMCFLAFSPLSARNGVRV